MQTVDQRGQGGHQLHKAAAVAQEAGCQTHHQVEQPHADPDHGDDGADDQVAHGDEQGQVGVMGGQVAELMAQDALDLVVRQLEQTPGHADGPAAHGEGVDALVVADVQGDGGLDLHLGVAGLGGLLDLVKQGLHALEDGGILNFLAAVDLAEQPLAQGGEGQGGGQTVQQQTVQQAQPGVGLKHGHHQGDQQGIDHQIDHREDVFLLAQALYEIHDVQIVEIERLFVHGIIFFLFF